MNRVHTLICILLIAVVGIQTCAKDKPKPKDLDRGFIDQYPPDRCEPVASRRNPLFYVGEPIEFRLKGPAAATFEVHNYWGDIVDQGSADTTIIQIKALPPGWYKLNIIGKPVEQPAVNTNPNAAIWTYRQRFGAGVGGTMFVVMRDNPNFPKLPADGKYPAPGICDEVIRGVCGIGPQRHSADASKPEESIARLEKEIATDRELYLPFDKARRRELMIAFPNGAKGKLEGVRKIVEHFKADVHYYEPRNEPNFGATGADFVKNELADFYKTVKAVDPTLKVLGPGTVTYLPGKNGLDFIEDFLKAGGADSIDGFSFHAYNCLNGDWLHARKSLTGLKDLLAKYGADKKELWQTEQGYFACVYGIYQPRLQGRWTMLEMLAFDQFGLPREHNHLWYDVSHGFWDYPTFWENGDRGFNPAVPLMRVLAEEQIGTHFVKAYDFGATGNKLYLGNLYEGENRRVAAFMSAGMTDGKVEVAVTGGRNLHLVSAFGVESEEPVGNGRAIIPVSELPVYVELAADQKLEVIPQDRGNNLARMAGVALSSSGTSRHPVDPTIPNDITKLNNGQFENWYYLQKPAGQPWMDDTKDFPAWIEIKFPEPTEVGRVIIYCPNPWQWQGTLVDYELQYDRDGQWGLLDHVNEPLKVSKVLTPTARTRVDSYFSDRHIFEHAFIPVKTTRLRLYVHNTTFGGGPTELVEKSGGQTGPHHVNLQEIEVYAK